MPLRLASLLIAVVLFRAGAPAGAQQPSPSDGRSAGTITGTVVSSNGNSVAGAQISVNGPSRETTMTDARGIFRLSVPPGIYAITVSKSGYSGVTREDVAVLAAQVSDVSVSLAPASFSSLKEIGHVTVGPRQSRINTSTAAVSDVSGQVFAEQGQQQVMRTLSETPGVLMTVSNAFAGGTANSSVPNAADQASSIYPQLRGALPYETASLIDGHPISIGRNGTFNPIFLNPNVLADVEIVKGPGAAAPNINYAIGGTINYRTLFPTQKPSASMDLGADGYGGQFSNFRATGTIDHGHLGYAFDYALDGTPGSLQNYPFLSTGAGRAGSPMINGVPTCQNPKAVGCLDSTTPNKPYQGGLNLNFPLMICCATASQQYFSRNELAKLHYQFSSTTALTVSYLGGQSSADQSGAQLYAIPAGFFTPPAGYSGSLPPGRFWFPNGFNFGGTRIDNLASMWQTEFSTGIGEYTVLGRFYSAVEHASIGGPGNSGPGDITVDATLYGGISLGNATTPTVFNGTPATVTFDNQYVREFDNDQLTGFSFEVDRPVGQNLYAVSYDETQALSNAHQDAAVAALRTLIVPNGSGETFRTVLARGVFELNPRVNLTFSNYFVNYVTHYSQDGGATFLSSEHSFYGPRLALRYRPTNSTSLRASAGSSIAPPYINLLTNSYGPPQPNTAIPLYYTSTANSGDVKPETAFGYDLGIDKQLARSVLVSADVYQTILHNQYIQATSVDGTYQPPAGSLLPPTPLPLYVTRTSNLGSSQYAGIELSISRAPTAGWGFKAQGALIRAYAYDVSPTLYATATGPLTANLAVLPDVNFVGGGQSFSGVSPSRVPYATGYAEINHRARNGSYALFGLTYLGNNNAYNAPAFAIMSATYRQPLTSRSFLQISAYNLTDAYGASWPGGVNGGGIGVPLINGKLGYGTLNVVGPTTFHTSLHYEF